MDVLAAVSVDGLGPRRGGGTLDTNRLGTAAGVPGGNASESQEVGVVLRGNGLASHIQ
jgi:hypothetical protein